jgi:hypothetical protein
VVKDGTLTKEITVHLDLFDYVSAAGEIGIADSFVPAMRQLVDSDLYITAGGLLDVLFNRLQQDAIESWSDYGEIKVTAGGSKLTYKDFLERYGSAVVMNLKLSDYDRTMLLEPRMINYVRLTIDVSDYSDKQRLMAEIEGSGRIN